MMIMLLLCLFSFCSLDAGNAFGTNNLPDVGGLIDAGATGFVDGMGSLIQQMQAIYDNGGNHLHLHLARNTLKDVQLRKMLRRAQGKTAPITPANGSNIAWVHEFKFSDPSKRDNDGRTPLHVVAKHGHDFYIAALVEYGANVDEKDNEGNTPLHIAHKYNKMNVANILRTIHGADETLINNAGQLPSEMG